MSAAFGEIRTLLDCDAATTAGDFTSRGFYITDYPGTSINAVTVYMSIDSGSHPYQIGLAVREGAYDGPLVASYWADATLNTTVQAVPIQMVDPTGTFTNPPVTPGSTLCFSFFINKQVPTDPTPFFEVFGDLGVDEPDATDPCPHIVETNGTTPPLDSFRREGVKIIVTGNPYLEVLPGYSIQLAIDNADPGDTVVVAPGTYTEDLNLRSDVSVVGAGAEETILNGTGTTHVVTANGVTNTEFSGFSVRNSSPSGAGFRIIGGSPLIKDNIVENNADGIYITSSSTAIVCGNIVRDNRNDADSIVDWGIIVLGGSTPLITNNLVLRNEVGIYLFPATTSGTQIINNTVMENDGDGIWCNQSSPTVKNNLVSQNGLGIFAMGGGVPALTYNNVWDNAGTDYGTTSGGVATPGIGSISADPLLGPSYELLEGSPCIDAGDPAAIHNDLDGSRNDIGWTGGPCGSPIPGGTIVNGFLWTSVGTIPVSEIDQTNGPKGGLTLDRDRPFGGHPWLYGPFGSAETGIYRYAVKIGPWVGNTPPAPGDFVYVDDPLSKVRYSVSGATVTATNVALGPTIFWGIPTYTPTDNGGSTYWAHENLRLKLNTLGLTDGRYSVRMEAYNFFGLLITLSPNPDLILTVNNRRPYVSIDAVSLDGGPPFDECSIIDMPAEIAHLDFVYTANHADGFLDNYSLHVLVGRNRSGGTIVSDSYTAHVDPNGVWNGETMTPVTAAPADPEPPLPALQQWETCAYQFRISAWARTTNGFGRLYYTTFFDNYTLDLEPPPPCTPDLDGDGDVDAEDLAIMAASYGLTLSE